MSTIAAMSSNRTISMDNTNHGASFLSNAVGNESDYLTSYQAFLRWRKGRFTGDARQFCRENGMNYSLLQQIDEQRVQLIIYAYEAGMLSLEEDERVVLNKQRYSYTQNIDFELPFRFNKNASNEVVNAIVALSLYPRLLKREGRGYRNIYTNQHMIVASTSTISMCKSSPKWLCFGEAMQSKTGKLSVSDVSRVRDIIILLLLGHADYNFLAGVVSIDDGRVKFALQDWRELFLVAQIRSLFQRVTEDFLAAPSQVLPFTSEHFLDSLAQTLGGL